MFFFNRSIRIKILIFLFLFKDNSYRARVDLCDSCCDYFFGDCFKNNDKTNKKKEEEEKKKLKQNEEEEERIWIQEISHKLINPKEEYKISLNGDSFYVYVNHGSKHKKNKKTLVFLPGYSYLDHKDMNKKYIPHKDFEKLIDNLKEYRTVVIEYFGYNESDDTDRKRSAEEICHEINYTMHLLGIKKYILMPHSISGLYAMHYINKYPKEVDGLIGIDITLPYYFLEGCDSNDKFLLEHKFNDESRKVPEAYRNMYTYFWETAKLLESFKFPKALPVILFTSTQLIKNIDKEIEKKILKPRVEDYLNTMITNNNTQKIHVLEGTHYLHDSQYKNMSEIIKQNLFLGNKK